MDVTARSYLTAGIAAFGVGALALAPVQPIPHQVALAPQRVVENLAVDLAATVDPIQAWVNTFEAAGANLQILGEFYMQKPFPLLQTIGANIATYVEELGNGQGALIPGQIWNNIQTFFNAPWDPGAMFRWTPTGGCPEDPCPTVSTGAPFELDGKLPTASDTLPFRPGFNTMSPQGLELAAAQILAGVGEGGMPAFANLLGLEPPDSPENIAQASELWKTIASYQWLLDQLWTPAVGQLMGLLGTVIAPVVQLTRSFTAIGAAFQAGEILDAVYELINIPANMTNAFLNGLDAPLDLTGVLSNFLPLPEGLQLGLQFGGLLNSMPYNGSLNDPDDPPTEYSSGVLFDNISVIADPSGFLEDQNPYGLKNGWAGSVIGLGQLLAEQMLVSPPEAPEQAAADASTLVAPVDVAPAALPEAPADDAPATVLDASPAPVEAAVVVDELVAEETPAIDTKVVADAEVTADADPVVVDIPEVEAPAEATAAADDPAPKPAASIGSDDSDNAGDSGTRSSDSRRGAGSAD